MSIETLLAANIKATEALTEALTQLVPALATAGKKATAKDKATSTTTAADPAATSGAAPAGTAAGSAAGAATSTPSQLDPQDPFSIAVTHFARTHGREAAHAFIKQFGGEGRASTIKEIDRPAAFEWVKKEHARLDAVKAAAKAVADAAAATAAAGGNDLI